MAPKWRPSDPQDLVNRYLAGASEVELSAFFGVGRSTIVRHLEKLGVQRRSMSDAQRINAGKKTPEQRSLGARAAHDAVRGRVHSWDEKCRRAQTRQAKLLGVSPAELVIAEWLKARGVDAVPQQAIGAYNADLGAFPVAVEVFGGGWHASGRHAVRSPDRARYILNQGWNLMVIWIDGRRFPLKSAAADQIVAFMQESRLDPAMRGQYRVIWGDGQIAVAHGLNPDDVSLKPTRG